ncbi:uncharacterized protein VDAG_04831 [Verticillium dahliae VdLs.17]|uniref:Chromo domain-containing protein n=1 Tax=Verticillium dahliae (strain VdLs.17 / ATCC MYA-4575 / FGSC 10137) TaxID=498257 RepID=G2X346_VERDV|nr:uncharacterized protein VDAG_04831 [Verticillium dahliae VdLs.17]EGY23393.1 hypothetical protein VDAG_04831 [Verticillium dahliae VdLs.17]
MSRPFQNYDPFTKSFRPSLSKQSHSRASGGKRPGGVRSKLVSRPSPELSEQSVDFPDDEFRPSEQLSVTTGVIDLTRTDIVPPPEQYGSPNDNHVADDRPIDSAPPSYINAPKQHDKPSTSDAQISNLTVSGTDDCLRTNGARHRASPLAKLKETRLHLSNGDQSVALIDPSVHDAGRLDSQSLPTNIAEINVALVENDAGHGITATGDHEVTVLASVRNENDVWESPVKTDEDQLMVDMGNHANGQIGKSIRSTSTGSEQGQPVDVVADGDWEITELIGKEVIQGKVHYLVRWQATLVPEDEINAPELIGRFEAKFGVKASPHTGSSRVAKQTRPTKMRKTDEEAKGGMATGRSNCVSDHFIMPYQ